MRSLAKSRWMIPGMVLAASVPLFWWVPLLGLLGLVAACLVIVARLDNHAGTLLPLAVLVVIVLAVMAFLLAGLAYIHAMMSGR